MIIPVTVHVLCITDRSRTVSKMLDQGLNFREPRFNRGTAQLLITENYFSNHVIQFLVDGSVFVVKTSTLVVLKGSALGLHAPFCEPALQAEADYSDWQHLAVASTSLIYCS